MTALPSSPALSPGVAHAAPHRPALSATLLYHAARRALRRQPRTDPDITRTTTPAAYRNWRRNELAAQLNTHFDVSQITDRDLLDFGCGTGELSLLLADHHPRTITGLDLSATAIHQAQAACESSTTENKPVPRFLHATSVEQIPLPDHSIDLLCCFDVLEHIPDLTATLREWRRILRPTGRIWIWWSPWRNPWGHHLRALIPLPWFHLLFSESAIFDACARIYDSPDFVPRNWDLDASTGQRKPNKWRATRSFRPFLNQLNRSDWEQSLAAAGFAVLRRETHGCTGHGLRRLARSFAHLPLVGECFVTFFVYELSLPV